MRRRKLLWALPILLLAVSCGRNRGESAATAAEDCYRCLMEGKYDEFIGQVAYSDSMTDSYRSQMVDLVAQYAEREKARTGGIVSVRALSDSVSDDVASVFLEIMFADSTREEVCLPMVRCGNEWKMQ